MKNEDLKVAIERRLTKLETKDDIRGRKQDEIIKELHTLTTRFDRYEAKWGGVLMVFSALIAIVTVAKDAIMGWFNGR